MSEILGIGVNQAVVNNGDEFQQSLSFLCLPFSSLYLNLFASLTKEMLLLVIMGSSTHSLIGSLQRHVGALLIRKFVPIEIVINFSKLYHPMGIIYDSILCSDWLVL